MVKFEFNHRFYSTRMNMTVDLVNCGPHVFLSFHSTQFQDKVLNVFGKYGLLVFS